MEGQRGGGPRAGPTFSPSVTRATSCVVLRLKDPDKIFLIFSLSHRSDSQVISINSCNGKLEYSQKKGEGNFSSEGEALDYLSDLGSFEILERGCTMLGYAALGSTALILLATRLRDCAVLPGGHQVRLVAESKWLSIKLPEYEGPQLGQTELERIDNLQSYTLNNAHYFCETADITRPFPSRHPVSDPSWEFVWNRWLTQPFRELSLGGHCPPLLQGVAESRVLEDAEMQKFMLILFSRRSRLHPGMRYIARGLNSLASPGNEIECEQLVLTCPEPDEALKWSTYVWRRGTVPIWWSVELKQGGVGEATINVNARSPYKGTRRYFRRLQKRYNPDLGLQPHHVEAEREEPSPVEADASSEFEAPDPTSKVRVVCVNLLRCNMQRRDELLLSEHFSEGVRRVRKSLPGSLLRVLNFDWHGMMKDLKEEGTVEGFWSLLESCLPQMDITQGTMAPSRDGSSTASTSGASDLSSAEAISGAPGSQRAESKSDRTKWASSWDVTWQCQQQGIVRYNCADSLDRTNAASYFAAVQVLSEQARRLGIRIESSKLSRPPQDKSRPQQPARSRQRDLNGALEISNVHQRVKKFMANKGNESAPDGQNPDGGRRPDQLPFGWEERLDPTSGRRFYIDHVRKRTTWERPESPSVEQSRHLDKDLAHLLHDTRVSESSSALRDDPETTDGQAQKEPAWGLLGLTVPEIRQTLRADVVTAQAEIFLVNGDINSNLYTSTRAMHSAIIGLLQGEGGAVSKAGVGRLANLSVTLQRRWANVLSDFTRQTVVECFLGLRLKEHFPKLQLVYPGEQGVPLDDQEEDEKDLDESPPTTMTSKGGLPPDLTNQANLPAPEKGAGDSAPAGGELKPSLLDEAASSVGDLLTFRQASPSAFAQDGPSFDDVLEARKARDLTKSLSATDPGAFLSPRVSGESIEARKGREESLI